MDRDSKRIAVTRRDLLAKAAMAVGATSVGGVAAQTLRAADAAGGEKRGAQRLSIDRLQKWERLGYGMFLCFGMTTYDGHEFSDGNTPASAYAPDKLDVDQWVAVARDAGMKYIVLTAKHVAGHCLWPSKHTDYTVANSTDKTNVVEKFVDSCRKRGVLPGLYYCAWDNHHRFGSKTPSDFGLQTWYTSGVNWFPPRQLPPEKVPPFTTSLYQTFMTAQMTELLTGFGPIAEIWIDIPGVLGRGYREFLYNHMARLQQEAAIIMNGGAAREHFNVPYAWPSDLVAAEKKLSGNKKWYRIEGKDYYIPGEVSDTIGSDWFFAPGDKPKTDDELSKLHSTCRQRGMNLLLSVPPDKHGVIPKESIAALARLAKNVRV